MISVIIPTYNRSRTIERSIRSVLAQTRSDWELLIVDDGSADDTREIVEKIGDERIRYIYQENAGACAARNNGIMHARGEYIAFHDSDDLCRPDRLEKQLAVLLREKADMVCSHVCGHSGDRTYIEPQRTASVLTALDSLRGLGTTGFFAKAEVFRSTMFDEEMPRWQDLEILTRIYAQYRLFLSDDVVVDVYEQPDSISRNPDKCIRAFELMMQKHPEIRQERSELYYYLLKLCARSKAELDRKDCTEDFRILYEKRKDVRSLVWYLAARTGMAGKVFRLFC